MWQVLKDVFRRLNLTRKCLYLLNSIKTASIFGPLINVYVWQASYTKRKREKRTNDIDILTSLRDQKACNNDKKRHSPLITYKTQNESAIKCEPTTTILVFCIRAGIDILHTIEFNGHHSLGAIMDHCDSILAPETITRKCQSR